MPQDTHAPTASAVFDIIAARFSTAYAEHGDTSQAVGMTERSQRARFQAIARALGPSPGSVLDVGCGLAHFYDYLTEQGVSVDYAGVDLSEPMIAAARMRRPAIADRLSVGNFIMPPLPDGRVDFSIKQTYDFVIANGILNVGFAQADDEATATTRLLIERMWAHCRRGIVITMTSDATPKPAIGTVYYHPSDMFYAVKYHTPWVALDHSYLPHDFALAGYRTQERD